MNGRGWGAVGKTNTGASDDGSGSDLWIAIASFPFRRSARPSVASWSCDGVFPRGWTVGSSSLPFPSLPNNGLLYLSLSLSHQWNGKKEKSFSQEFQREREETKCVLLAVTAATAMHRNASGAQEEKKKMLLLLFLLLL